MRGLARSVLVDAEYGSDPTCSGRRSRTGRLPNRRRTRRRNRSSRSSSPMSSSSSRRRLPRSPSRVSLNPRDGPAKNTRPLPDGRSLYRTRMGMTKRVDLDGRVDGGRRSSFAPCWLNSPSGWRSRCAPSGQVTKPPATRPIRYPKSEPGSSLDAERRQIHAALHSPTDLLCLRLAIRTAGRARTLPDRTRMPHLAIVNRRQGHEDRLQRVRQC